MTMTDDEYAAKIAEHEAKIDQLELAERALCGAEPQRRGFPA
jgi:hypothetical protein